MTLKQRTVSGVMWMGIAKMSMQISLSVVTLILARLLTPDDFGILGMAAVITVAIGLVNERGFGTAIIQKQDISSGHLSSVFWGGVFFSFIFYLVAVIAAFPLSVYFKTPVVIKIILVQALGFIFGAFGVVHRSLLTKQMAFKKLAIVEIISVILSGIVSIVLALMGFGVWSLVLGMLLRDVCLSFSVWIVISWKPAFHFKISEFKELFGFSAYVLANNLAVYANTNADVFVIGRVLGAYSLGLYTVALNLVKLPVTRLSGVVSRVVFPAFSKLQDDTIKLKTGFLKSITIISMFTFPILALLGLYSEFFVNVFLGEKWPDLALPLTILTPMAMLKSVGTIKGAIILAKGRPDIEVKWNLFYLPFLVIAVMWGAKYGIAGAASAFTVLYIITFPVIQTITNRLIDITWIEFISALKFSLIATTGLVALSIPMLIFMKNFLIFSDLGVLIVGIPVSIIIYSGLYWIFGKKLIQEVWNLIFIKKTRVYDSLPGEEV